MAHRRSLPIKCNNYNEISSIVCIISIILFFLSTISMLIIASIYYQKENKSKNMICASADEFEQLLYEYDSMKEYYNYNQTNTRSNPTMEKLNCMFPGVQPVQVLEPEVTELVKDGANTTVYERFTSGFEKDENDQPVEIKVFIRKTVTVVDGSSTIISKFKAFAKWSERASVTYVPYNSPLTEHSVR